MSIYEQKAYTNNISGNLNKKNDRKYKQIDLDDLDVQMMSPHFLQTKTLKKPLKDYQLSLDKTNPQGVSYFGNQHSPPTQDRPSSVNFQKEQPKSLSKKSTISVVDASELDIKPAYRQSTQSSTTAAKSTSPSIDLPKDKNTIFAAIMKKGLKPQAAIKPEKALPKDEKKIGPAQAKLKSMMNKKEPIIEASGPKVSFKKKEQKKQEPEDIGEQIVQQYDDYGNESFQKLSGAYQSAIRESIAGESMIKQSIAGQSVIKESIMQSIQAASTSKMKESIRQQIRQSIGGGSSRSLRQEIIEEISASKAKSKQSIEQVYQEVFEDIADSNSLSKSRSGFKKSYNQKEMQSLSQSQSKSFRMKTNVVKSLKYAQQLVKKQKQSYISKKIDDPILNEEIAKQKINIKLLQQNIGKFLKKQKKVSEIENKNKDLYFNFKKQINRLITSQNFQSKLKKLSSFLTISSDIAPDSKKIGELQEGILKNVMKEVQNIRVGQHHLNQIQKIKQDYQQKLKEQLLKQEVQLRAEMNQKLSDKDFELKKMIAELESRMMNRSFYKGGQSGQYAPQRSQQYEVQSDYSIDSDNVSWKADLWQLLPQYEKKKLYDKQSSQVTKFLADIMMNQLQSEALDRSLDISFQFPEEYNNIPVNTYNNYPISQKSHESSSNYSQTPSYPKQPSFKKVQKSNDFLSDLPKLNLKRSHTSQSSNNSQRMQQLKSERIKRDEKIKTQIIKILSDYKHLYIRKKQDVIRNLLKVINSRDKQVQKYMLSSIQLLSVLSQREYRKDHKMYVKAYQQELFMNLLGIYNRSLNKKQSAIEEQMKKMYDRLVVVCQVSIAEKCTERIALDAQRNMKYNVEVLTKQAISQMEQHPCLLQVPTNENYMQLKTKMQEKQIKGDIVKHIVNVLTSQFAKQFPKRKK